jgi:O-antigen ligase
LNKYIISKNRYINNYESLLAFAILLAPFNLLRISFFGFSEIILFCCFLFELSNWIKNNYNIPFQFVSFWIKYLIVLIISTLINVFVFSQTDSLEGAFDFFSYLFVLLTCFIFEKKILFNEIEPYVILKKLFFWLSLLLILLYLYSFFNTTLLGLPLFYYDRFAPLVDNPHKIAILSSILPFIGLKIISKEKGYSLFKKSYIIFLITMVIVITMASNTTKSKIGIILGCYIYFLIKFINPTLRKFLIAISIIGIFISFLFFDYIEFFIQSFKEVDYEGGRNTIYNIGFEKFLESPFIGFGPGSHVILNGIRTDAHSTILTIGLQGGIIALFLFIVFFSRIIFRLIKTEIAYASMFIPILIYILGGDILRTNFIWVIIILIFYHRDRFIIRNH